MDGIQDIYSVLQREAANLPDEAEFSGVDSFLSDRVKIASMDDLLNFVRIGNDTLVHKAEKDLWRIGDDGQGGMIIERLFDPESGKPIKV